MPKEILSRLTSRFCRAALAHAAAMERLNDIAAAQSAANLSRLYAAIASHGVTGREALLALTASTEPAVAGMAAVFSLRYNTDRCRSVLISLAARPGLLGFRAAAALERWDRGEWELD